MPHPRLAAGLTALGLTGVSIALGLLYRDVTNQDRARAEIALMTRTRIESVDSDDLWHAWSPRLWAGALVSGTLGVATLGAGATIILYDLACAFRSRSQPGR